MDDGCWQAGSKARKKYMLLRLPANSFLPLVLAKAFHPTRQHYVSDDLTFFPPKRGLLSG